MSDEEKLKLLDSFFAQYGKSLKNREVQEFLYTKRKTYVDQVERCYGYRIGHRVIKPSMITTLPLYFENSSYSNSGDTIMKWFMHESTIYNPFFQRNLEKSTFDIVGSFSRTKNNEPVVCDNEDNLFNLGDGNHRLLTLMIQHFAKRSACSASR